jgi:hypothetical protein
MTDANPPVSDRPPSRDLVFADRNKPASHQTR